MSDSKSATVTVLLQRAHKGDSSALEECLPLVYEELRRIASRVSRREYRDGTLATTALVNEAYLRLLGEEPASWSDRGHFFAVAARAMRFIQVDYARQRQATKRGGDLKRLDLEFSELSVEEQADVIIAVHSALDRLKEVDERLCQVVECRFFAGYTESETAQILGVTDRTVRRLWVRARAWLYRFLSESSEAEPRADA